MTQELPIYHTGNMETSPVDRGTCYPSQQPGYGVSFAVGSCLTFWYNCLPTVPLCAHMAIPYTLQDHPMKLYTSMPNFTNSCDLCPQTMSNILGIDPTKYALYFLFQLQITHHFVQITDTHCHPHHQHKSHTF